MNKSCPLCETGFPLFGPDHIPTQRLGMIPSSRCRKLVTRQDVRRYREHLNNLPGGKYRERKFGQRTRAYGDYLFHQDKERFMADLCCWLTENQQ